MLWKMTILLSKYSAYSKVCSDVIESDTLQFASKFKYKTQEKCPHLNITELFLSLCNTVCVISDDTSNETAVSGEFWVFSVYLVSINYDSFNDLSGSFCLLENRLNRLLLVGEKRNSSELQM